MARPRDGTTAVRLARLAEAAVRSAETNEDTVSALHTACRDAETEGWSVRDIAKTIGKSPTQTHRILTGLTGRGECE